MAGGGFLSSIISLAVDKLRALESPPSSSASADPPRANIEQEMTKLKKTMRRIQAKLAISEQHDSSSEQVKLWLSELKDTAYDAQDVVEEYQYELLRAQAQHEEVCHSNTAVVDELAGRVKQIIKSSEKIAEEWKALKLSKKTGKRKRTTPPISNRQTGSLVAESGVLGREKEKKILADWILSEDDASANRVSVIALTGMGGLGKTTVAQLVYNDLRVKSYFDLRGWISVSEHFDVAALSRKILRSFFKERVDSENVKELQHELKKGLKGKKFLLVLDDVWNEELKLWNQLKKPLLSAKFGKVVVTTRLDSVARIMQTTDPLILDILPFDACWSLFERIAFAGRDLNACQDLVNIGWCIAEKCKGLPLAAKVLGGALRNEEDEKRWIDILESEIWELDQGQAGVLPALKITYDSLPVELKRCFPYLSLFPKYTVLHRRRIVPLWMSHGLLQPARGKQVEEVGYEHLKELVERSMLNLYFSDSDSDDEEDVTDVYDEDFGNTLVEEDATYVMHDLVHDLARYVAQDEYLCVSDANFDLKKSNKVRHLTVNLKHSERAIDIRKFQELQLLRTLFIRGGSRIQASISGVLDDLFRKLKCLRALDLGYTNITELPESVGSLKLLRSFSIRGTGVKKLPESICNLYNLQTLNLSETYYCEVPRQLGNLVNLRHLFLYSGHVYLPPGIGKLTNLQTLSNFFVSRSGEHCGIGELNGLVQLRGLLSIDCLRFVSKECLLLDPPLKTKLHLDTLVLSWGYDGLDYHHVHNHSEDEDHDSGEDAEEEEDNDNSEDGEEEDHEQGEEEMAEQLLEFLRPHNNLEKLHIDYYPGLRFAGWVGDPSFDKLVQVFLSGCRRCEFLPPLGQLPSLESVHLDELNSVQHIGREFCAGDGNSGCKAFPKLDTLSILRLPNWVKWDGVEAGDFPAIDFLEVNQCSKLAGFPQHLISAVKQLDVKGSGGGLSALKDLNSLTRLFSYVRSQNDQKWMLSSYLPALQHLTLESSVSSVRLSQSNLPSLKTLEILYSPKLASVEGLKELTSLNSLVVRECPRLEFKELLPATLEQVKLSESPLFEQGYNKQLKERRVRKTLCS
ncbi:putative disease resistance protein RGA3 [Curcuma longa]|uniref:putative disease resistance protein RGA3 n=1 Tax=Curcuma longa TaxID=136217 RepID=UPI003D9E9033